MTKYKITEQQIKRLQEIRLMRESMRKMGAVITEGVIDELSPQTYMSTHKKAIQRGDPRGTRVAQTSFTNLLKPYEGEVFHFIGDSGERYRAVIRPQDSALQPDLFENDIVRLIMKFSPADGGGEVEYYIVSIDSSGGVGASIHGGGKSTRLISDRRTANLLAKIYNDISTGSGGKGGLTPNQFAQR